MESGCGSAWNSVAKKAGIEVSNGCMDIPDDDWCKNPKVVTYCPETCPMESGCGSAWNSVARQTKQLLGATQDEVIGNNSTPGQIAVQALAVVGGISIIVNAFTKCTRKAEYKAVSEKKSLK